MFYRLLLSSAFAFVLTLVGYAGQADAAPRLMPNGASGLVILAADEENAEVQNLLEPETDGGTPMGADAGAKPEAAPQGEEAPEGRDGEMKEIQQEEGK